VFDKMPVRDVVSWNAMIAGYVQNGQGGESLKLFSQMQLAGMKADSVTVSSILPACANLADLEQGKKIHDYITSSGFESDVFVGSALVDMYAKCRSIENARHVFDKMSRRDVVTWNSMIAGYAQNGLGNEALMLMYKMQLSGMKPNSVTVMSVLSVCTNLAALQQGKEIHGLIIRDGLESDVIVGSALVVMYAKCGNIIIARQVFDRIPQRDVALWNAIISGYAMHGRGEETLKLFYEMQQARIAPDGITLTSVLSACSHAGLVNEGWQYFRSMSRDYGIMPTVEHYACMVDLLGRSGCLSEAQHFINKMPLEPDACVLGALLGACRVHGNIELAECVAERLFVLEPQNAGNYVLLSNIYATAGRGDDVAKIRKMMRDRGLIKNPGCSWIEVDNKVHAFYVGDKSHPQAEVIYAMLESLAGQMKDAGYAPNMNFVLQDVEEEDKGLVLYGHSEKLAIIFGLINTCPGTSIRVINNLRMCGDCHHTTKFISRFVRREIFVRDTNRFHHFRDGICSCGDYW